MNIRTECSPRIIKRKNIKENTDDASKYGFYRQINHLSILRLDNESDKMNYSSWLTRLDNETSDLKMHLIKLLFVSLRSDQSFQMFLKPPPDDLKDLELRADNTMDMVKWLQDNNIGDESLTNKEKKQEITHKRSAAVATNMRSYTTIKSSPYFVQSFYVRSDWPIYTWYNPTSIRLPSNFDHNQWELFLNRFQIIVTEDKSSTSKHRNECDDIISIDQVSKEVTSTSTFNWHPYSILISEETRPKRTAGSIVIDLDIGNHQCNQQQIDDAAYAIVFCKVFPGNKILSQRMYSEALIPDAKFIFKMTGVTLVDYSDLKFKKDEKLPFICKLKQRKRAVKNQCGVKDKKPCPCEKPMMTIDCSKSQLPCSTTVAQNAKPIIQAKPFINTISTTNTNTNTVNTDCNSKFSNLDMKYQECNSNPKCLNKSAEKTKLVESCKFPKEAESNINDNNESEERKNCSTVLNVGRPSFGDSSNYDWTVSSVGISMREPDRPCSSTKPAAKEPNCNVNCVSTSSDQVTNVQPEDQSALHCRGGVQKTAIMPPCQSPRTTESVREPPQERQVGPNLERSENDGGRAEAIFGSGRPRTSPGQRMSAPEPHNRSASVRGSTSDDGQRAVGQCPAKNKNSSCPAAFAEYRPLTAKPPDTSAAVVSCSDRGASQQQQKQQHESVAGPSSDNRSTSAVSTTATWDPEVTSYTAFSDRHMAEDRSRFLTSERTVNDCRPMASTSPRPSSSPLPQLLVANEDDDLSDDWSDEVGFDGCQSCVVQTDRFHDNNNNNNYDIESSLSTLTSSDSSIENRLAARYPLGRNVNNARRTDHPQLSISNNDRYPFDDRSRPNLSGASMEREGHTVAEVCPPTYDLIEDVSMPGSLVTGPWSLSMSNSRSSRVREFGDVGAAPDQYDTSCSEGGNASGGDDYGGSETDD